MAADTFTVIPEKLESFDMFRLEVFDGKQSVSHTLKDTEEEAVEEGLSWGAIRVDEDGNEIADEKEYQAVCGSWDCRAPECKPR